MRRRFPVAALLLLVVAGCQTATTTPGPTLPPGASIPASPSASLESGATSAPSAPPTVEELAAAYLAAATKYNKADDAAWAAYKKSSKGLKATRRLANAYAADSLAFIRHVQAIPWWGDPKAIARRLLSCDNEAYVWWARAAKEKSLSQMVYDINKGDAKATKCQGIANELRIALNLPPVPID